MYEQLPPAIEGVRRGAGPILFEADVVRLDPHSSSDGHRKYRSELAALAERDPVLRTEGYLIRHVVLTPDEVESFCAFHQGRGRSGRGPTPTATHSLPPLIFWPTSTPPIPR
jgi:TPP-dependent pyruvate/acetoin dehydrogenase alpha subunit